MPSMNCCLGAFASSFSSDLKQVIRKKLSVVDSKNREKNWCLREHQSLLLDPDLK